MKVYCSLCQRSMSPAQAVKHDYETGHPMTARGVRQRFDQVRREINARLGVEDERGLTVTREGVAACRSKTS
jgi:hypothetical protein